jgi:hypothetical protein
LFLEKQTCTRVVLYAHVQASLPAEARPTTPPVVPARRRPPVVPPSRKYNARRLHDDVTELTPPADTPKKHDRLAVGMLVLLGTLFFADVLFGVGNFYMRDLTRYYYPTKQVLREIVQNGEFPYWNRYFSGGQPIAANPEHEVFYPFTWLILLPNYDLGYRLHILIHVYIGLLGMYALLRSMQLRPYASFFGALCFGLGGTYLSYINLLPILFCAAWLPLTCLYVRRFLLQRHVRDFALAGLFLGLQFLVGEPTTVMQTGFLIGMYAMYRGWYDARDRRAVEADPDVVPDMPVIGAQAEQHAIAEPVIVDAGDPLHEASVDDVADGADPLAIDTVPAYEPEAVPVVVPAPIKPRQPSLIARAILALRNVGWIAILSICAIAVGAAQMIPAIDHVGDSARSRVFGFDLVSAWSLPWAKLAELIYPNILGHIAIDRVMWYWGGGLYPGMGSPFLFSIYGGLLVTALFVAGLFARPRGSRFVIILMGFSLLMALGGHTPLLKWLYDAHIASSIRYPEKFILIGAFAMVIFAAQMLDRVLAGDDGIRDTTLGFVLATTMVAAVVAILAFTPLYAPAFMKVWGLGKGAGTTKMIGLSRVDWILAAVRGAVLFALLWTVRMRRRDLWLAMLTIFLCADLGYVLQELNPRMPQHFFTGRTSLSKKLPAARADFRVFHEADWYGQEATARSFFSTGDAVYWIVRNGIFPMTPAGQQIRTVLERDYDKTALIPTIDLVDSVWDVKRSGRKDWYRPFMAMSNAWYRAEYADFKTASKRARGNMKAAEPIVLVEGEHYPRYYFADEVVKIADRYDMVKKLSTPTHGDRVAFVGSPSFKPAAGKVSAVRETANHARMDVESSGRAFLVMSVTPHKYWTVTIDGRRVQPLVTNIGYQGIEVPAGRHVVEMHYRNTLVQAGAAISAFTALLLAIVAIAARRARRTVE